MTTQSEFRSNNELHNGRFAVYTSPVIHSTAFLRKINNFYRLSISARAVDFGEEAFEKKTTGRRSTAHDSVNASRRGGSLICN